MKARKQIQPHFELQTVVLVQLFSTMNTTREKQIQRQNIHKQIKTKNNLIEISHFKCYEGN